MHFFLSLQGLDSAPGFSPVPCRHLSLAICCLLPAAGSQRVLWRRDHMVHPSLDVTLAEVINQKVSPPNKSKVKLQLELKDADPVTFLFEGQTARQDRDGITEWITKLRTQGVKALPQAASTSSKAAARGEAVASQAAGQPAAKTSAAHAAAEKERRQKKSVLLQTNELLSDTYKELVKGGELKDKRFWEPIFGSGAEAATASQEVSQAEVDSRGGLPRSICHTTG